MIKQITKSGFRCCLVILAMISVADAAVLQCIQMVLPAGENLSRKQVNVFPDDRLSNYFSNENQSGVNRFADTSSCVEFQSEGPGMVDVAIVVTHAALTDQPEMVLLYVDGNGSGRVYREAITHHATRQFTLRLDRGSDSSGSDTIELYPQSWLSAQVLFIMERVGSRCTMSATVSGDGSGHFYGDIAYFNVHKSAVREGMAAGSLSDPDSLEMMGDFIEGMADMARVLEEQGYDTGLSEEQKQELGIGAEPSSQSTGRRAFEQFAQEELAPEPGSSGDNFGLSLTDVKMNELDTAVDPSALLSNSFTLTVSGNLNKQQGAGATVKPSTVTASIGLSSDNGDRIPFVLPEEGGVEIVIYSTKSDVIFGNLHGRLTTKDHYTITGVAENRRLDIDVNVNFAARQGAWGCMQ